MVHPSASRLRAAYCFAGLLSLSCAVCATQAQTRDKGAGEAKVPELAALEKARADAAQKSFEEVMVSMSQTVVRGSEVSLLATPEDAYVWSIRWLNAQREVDSGKGNQTIALENHLVRMKDVQNRVLKMPSALLSTLSGPVAAQYYVAEAEFWLAQEKAKEQPSAKRAASVTPVVRIITPSKRTIDHAVVQPGFVQAYEQTAVFSRISGYIRAAAAGAGGLRPRNVLLSLARRQGPQDPR
jgi:hypothetical protein